MPLWLQGACLCDQMASAVSIMPQLTANVCSLTASCSALMLCLKEVVKDNGICRPFRLVSDNDVDKQNDGNKLP